MSRQLVETSDVKADLVDIEMGKTDGEVDPQGDSVITEHKIPIGELAAHMGTDFEKGLTNEGKFTISFG